MQRASPRDAPAQQRGEGGGGSSGGELGRRGERLAGGGHGGVVRREHERGLHVGGERNGHPQRLNGSAGDVELRGCGDVQGVRGHRGNAAVRAERDRHGQRVGVPGLARRRALRGPRCVGEAGAFAAVPEERPGPHRAEELHAREAVARLWAPWPRGVGGGGGRTVEGLEPVEEPVPSDDRQLECRREGGRRIRRHEKEARTPLQRLVDAGELKGREKARWERRRREMDPFELHETIENWL